MATRAKRPPAVPASPALSTLSARLLTTMQERIVSGKIPPGRRLVERALCEEFGVSRGIVRESFVRLANCGLVDLAPDAGAKVSALTDEHVLDTFLFREGLESIAAEQCAQRMNRLQAAQLEQLAARFAPEYELHVAGRPSRLQAVEIAFHRSIVVGSGNALVRRAWDTAMLHFFRGVKVPPREMLRDAREACVDDHVAIAAAIKAGAAEQAGSLMKRHLEHGRNLFLQYQRHNAPLDAAIPFPDSPGAGHVPASP